MHAFLQALLEQWAGFLVAAAGVVAGAVKLAEVSSPFAKALGPLGTLIRGRAARKRQRLRDERQADREEREARREAEDAEIVDLKRQVAALTKRMPLLDRLAGYMAWDAGWHARNDIRLAAAQVHLEPHLTFDEWSQREDERIEAERAQLRVYQGAYTEGGAQ